MKRLFRAAKNRHIRASAAAGLKTSGAMPSSGSPTIDNSTGASEAVAVLSGRLGNALENIDIEGDFRSHLTAELDRLDSKAATYANSSLSFCSSAQPWDCDWAEAELIAFAWDCSLDVYGAATSKSAAQPDLVAGAGATKLELSIPCSVTGDIKATNCTVFTPAKQPGDGDVRSPYLVIAIRGSAGTLDNIVNLNGEPRDASALIAEGGVGSDYYTATRFHAHAGFLNAALKLRDLLSPSIDSFLTRNSRGTILFTGHSAGGAVASLLHLLFRARLAYQYTGAAFKCITFGSPPVVKYTTPADKLVVEGLISSAHILNIVNEYDLVARSDRRYILSMVQLYNSTDDQEKMHAIPGVPTSIVGGDGRPPWSLPEPELFHVGPIVILKIGPYKSDARMARTSPSAHVPGSAGSRLVMSAWQITPEELSKIVFCRLSVHSRIVYRDRIQKLRNGCFNGETGW
ncbi:hypothetical protein TWF696_001083 [Orbilia brochopaga]|uniref:Fungal lipase-type domain-containing protein n=1 Tax=Orbilia brochopaga TaxID=3140254 RepID=A0AAV9VDA5_9PEZI